MIQRHARMIDALGVVERELNAASKDGKFMIAVWSMTPDGLMMRTRTTWAFPKGALADAAAILVRDVGEELLRNDPEPLPLASLAGLMAEVDNEMD